MRIHHDRVSRRRSEPGITSGVKPTLQRALSLVFDLRSSDSTRSVLAAPIHPAGLRGLAQGVDDYLLDTRPASQIAVVGASTPSLPTMSPAA